MGHKIKQGIFFTCSSEPGNGVLESPRIVVCHACPVNLTANQAVARQGETSARNIPYVKISTTCTHHVEALQSGLQVAFPGRVGDKDESSLGTQTFLFHGTIAENIRLGDPQATDDEVIVAASNANIHEFVSTLPQGYNSLIGEKGIKLSGGQRQRVAIARALLRDSRILILDEALSAVDAENEAVIQHALERLMKNRTTMILAHRLSSVIHCDRILVLDRGRVTESGKHGALIEQGGIYANLMSEQARDAGRSTDTALSLIHI